ncbi:hypothetical protein KEM60_00202 [Austwickia sp. TVS 96-490-7B]|nr:hypothetical protein [Austwickia sp. TVS 96-490-7B]
MSRLALTGQLRGGGLTDHEPGPGADVHTLVVVDFHTLTSGDRILWEASAGWTHECPIARSEVFDPPSTTIGGKLRVPSTHTGICAAVHVRDNPSTRGVSPDQGPSTDSYDVWNSW